jgi:hypothetical protein
MRDARHLASSIQPIVCIPTHSFMHQASYKSNIVYIVSKLAFSAFWRNYFVAPSATPIDNSGTRQDYQTVWGIKKSSLWTNVRKTVYPKMEHIISDLSQLSYNKMEAMLEDICKRAKASGWPFVPVIIENHTKDIGDFAPILKFCIAITKASNIEVITSRELAKNIQSGLYPIRKANVG